MPRILVADPSIEIQELVEQVVERLGHEPLRAAHLNGSSNEVAAAVIEPADETSLALARELRRRRPDLPLVFTSLMPETTATRALRPSAYLLKPFRLRDLTAALATAIGKAEERAGT